MSKHLSNAETRKAKSKKNKSFNLFSMLYPDFGADSEGYPGGFIHLALIVAGILFTVVGIVFQGYSYVSTAFFVLAFAISGFYSFGNAYRNFKIKRYVSESSMVICACLICIACGRLEGSAWIMVFYQMFKFAEIFAAGIQQNRIQDVLGILPDNATLVAGAEHVKIKPAHIKKGDVLYVERGEVIPVDGVITEGLSSVDLSPLVKRSKSEAVKPGSKVYGGAVNISVPIIMTAGCDYGESAAREICSAFSALTDTKTEDENLSVKVCNLLCPVMLICAVLFGVIVPLFTGAWETGACRAAVMLLIGCPYSLPDSLVLSLLSAAGVIFGNGVIISSLKLFRKLSKVEAFVCNKTGTITEKEYIVTGVHGSGISDDALLALLVKVESQSDHPIAEAIRRYACYEDRTIPDEIRITELRTKGVIAEGGNAKVLVGNAAFLFDNGIDCELPEGGGTAIHAAINDRYCGYVMVENQLREGNYEAIEAMKAVGVKSFALLSGDMQSIVRPIASALNFDVAESEQTPEDKTNAVSHLSGNLSQGHTLAMAGDGFNEKSAGGNADVYIATSALDYIKDSNENVIALNDGISGIPYALNAAVKSARLSFMAISLHVIFRVVLMILALAGICPPAVTGITLACIGAAAFLESVFLFTNK